MWGDSTEISGFIFILCFILQVDVHSQTEGGYKDGRKHTSGNKEDEVAIGTNKD